MTDPRVRPITTTVEVCLRCGSTEPAELAPDCAHPRVVRLVELRPELADLVTQLRRARSYQAHIASELAAAAERECLAGRARVDEEPDVLTPRAGVVFLRPRDERLREPELGAPQEPLSPPWAPAPVGPAPQRPARPSRQRASVEQPELFGPSGPVVPGTPRRKR
ncbi:MAG: hypothetical protein EPO40_25055 [Myxococcaceae bacterium]|nr:MAG: hypothetical protein EPO40_25055 [Myxococcaceae bacterium]